MGQNLSTYLRTSMSHGVAGGSANVAGLGQQWAVLYTNTGGTSIGPAPASGDQFSLLLMDGQTAVQVKIGAGDATGIIPTLCMTYKGKVYILAGANVYFSAVNQPTVFNDPEAIGNGYVALTNQVGTPEDMIGIATFQGQLAFFGRQSIQVWQTPADPVAWQLMQTLENIGCIAKNSIKSKGDLDALFLSDTGIRSLRAREVTLNAFVDDIGSPIDSIIQSVLLAHQSDAATACAVIEPSTNSYWLFLRDTIYVLSYYPSSKVVAWSTYEPKSSTGATFTPSKFVVFQGQVYAWAGNTIYQYGGSNRQTYDATVATVELPWLDLKKPGTIKSAIGINAAFAGAWSISIGMDPVSTTLEGPVFAGTAYTYDTGLVPLSGQGSHFKARMVTTGATAAVFSSFVFHFQENEEV